MDESRFAVLTRSLTGVPSRRDILHGLVGAGLALGVTRRPDAVEAKKKRRPKKPKPNAFGCLEVGASCKNAGRCCSGICKGKKCRAHDTGTCKQNAPGVCTAPTAFVPCNNEAGCDCYRTTADSSFCAGPPIPELGFCAVCKKDADCLELGYPAGAACVPVSKGRCAGECESGTACLVPCGYEPPAPMRRGAP